MCELCEAKCEAPCFANLACPDPAKKLAKVCRRMAKKDRWKTACKKPKNVHKCPTTCSAPQCACPTSCEILYADEPNPSADGPDIQLRWNGEGGAFWVTSYAPAEGTAAGILDFKSAEEPRWCCRANAAFEQPVASCCG